MLLEVLVVGACVVVVTEGWFLGSGFSSARSNVVAVKPTSINLRFPFRTFGTIHSDHGQDEENSSTQLFDHRWTEQQKKILDVLPKRYRDLERANKVNYFSLFNNATFSKLVDDESSTSVEVVTFNGAVVGKELPSRSLYLRSFYPDLLRACLGSKQHVVLLGNPGTSKSVLQNVILAGLLLPDVPEESALYVVQEQLKGIKVIVRQLGTKVHLIDLDKKVHLQFGEGGSAFVMNVMDVFKPQDILYLYDPVELSASPFYEFDSPDQPRLTLSTMSARESRYKEYTKQMEANTVYMPLYTKPELVLVGRHMQSQHGFPERLKSLYTEENITARFNQFGGVIRNVLPESKLAITRALEGQRFALGKVTPDLAKHIHDVIADGSDTIDITMSNKLVLMDSVRNPEDADEDFRCKFTLIPSMDLANRIDKSLHMGALTELRALLMIAEAYKIKTELIRARIAFEQVLCKTMTTTTLKWGERPMVANVRANAITPQKYEQLDISPMELVERTVPYAELKVGHLVCPTQENFPFADMYYREKDGTLVVIQMWFGFTTENNDITESQIKEFKEFEDKLKIAIRRTPEQKRMQKLVEPELPAAEGAAGKPVKVKLVLVSAHTQADTAMYSNLEYFQSDDLSMFVWKPPKDYKAGP